EGRRRGAGVWGRAGGEAGDGVIGRLRAGVVPLDRVEAERVRDGVAGGCRLRGAAFAVCPYGLARVGLGPVDLQPGWVVILDELGGEVDRFEEARTSVEHVPRALALFGPDHADLICRLIRRRRRQHGFETVVLAERDTVLL